VQTLGQEKVSFLTFPEGLSWDFGTIKEDGGEVTHVFKFRNASSESVSIANINTYCRCTRAAVTKRVFKPGEHGEIQVAFNPYGYSGHISKGVRITTEPKSDFLLSFTADITPRKKSVEEEYPLAFPSGLRLDKTDLNFGTIKAGDKKTLSLKCHNSYFKPIGIIIENKSAGLLNIDMPSTIPAGDESEIELTYSPSRSLKDVGFHRDTLNLIVQGPSVSIPLTSFVAIVEVPSEESEAKVSISNSYQNLKDIRESSEDRKIEYSIRNIGHKSLIIRDIDCPNGFDCTLSKGISLEQGHMINFFIILHVSHFKEGRLFGVVKLMTNDPEYPVKEIMLSAKVIR
jgi:hypothetical protein